MKKLALYRLETPNDLDIKDRRKIAEAVNPLLADTFALFVKTKNFHWHMTGPHYRDYHLLLDEQSDQIFAMIDVLAERVRKLGEKTIHSIGQIKELQTLRDVNETLSADDMLNNLLEDNKSFLKNMRKVQACRYLVINSGTSESPEFTRQRDKYAFGALAVLRPFIFKFPTELKNSTTTLTDAFSDALYFSYGKTSGPKATRDYRPRSSTFLGLQRMKSVVREMILPQPVSWKFTLMKQNDEFGFYLKHYKINKNERPDERVGKVTWEMLNLGRTDIVERNFCLRCAKYDRSLIANLFFSARFTSNYELILSSSSTQTGA